MKNQSFSDILRDDYYYYFCRVILQSGRLYALFKDVLFSDERIGFDIGLSPSYRRKYFCDRQNRMTYYLPE